MLAVLFHTPYTMSSESHPTESQVGDYALEKEIGKGSFAQVYLAHHQASPQQLVAIKSVTRSKLSEKLLENLEGEISILKSMRHTNIVDLRDCIYTDEHIHLIMEFCPGGDLSQYIRKHGNVAPWEGDATVNPLAAAQRAKYPHPEDGGLNETMVRSFLAQLVSAVRFLRSKDIVHRDIKPQNLLLQLPDEVALASGHPREIPQIKLADFGFARSLPAASLAKTLCGSPLYMAPEILRYEKYDAKADLWSVGAVLYEMSVGKPPFRATNHVELLRRIEQSNDRIKFPDERSAQSLAKDAMRRKLHGEPPRPPAHPVAEDIKSLIRWLLKRHPVERMSFDELFADNVITQVPYTGRAIIKDELAASVHIAQLPPDMLSPPSAAPQAGPALATSLPSDPTHMDEDEHPKPDDLPSDLGGRTFNTAVGFHAPAATISSEMPTQDRRSPNPSALSRAISKAGDRMQIKGHNGAYASPSLPSTSQPGNADIRSLLNKEAKPMSIPRGSSMASASAPSTDDDLMHLLRSLAKKAYVLIEFADSRFAELHAPSMTSRLGYSPAESSPSSATGHLQEVAAAESLALYVRALGFLQQGLEAINAYVETKQGEPSHEMRNCTYTFYLSNLQWPIGSGHALMKPTNDRYMHVLPVTICCLTRRSIWIARSLIRLWIWLAQLHSKNWKATSVNEARGIQRIASFCMKLPILCCLAYLSPVRNI